MVLRKAFKFKLRLGDAAAALPFYRYAAHALQKKKRILSYEEMAAKLLRWKKQYPFLKEVPSQALQQRLMDLDTALRAACDPKNPKKFPRFKKVQGAGSIQVSARLRDREEPHLFAEGWLGAFLSEPRDRGQPKECNSNAQGRGLVLLRPDRD